jgi:integrase/recombinase XerC
MKLFPEATSLYVNSGIGPKTASSIKDYRNVLRLLQSRHPELHLDEFTGQILTRYCTEHGLAGATLAKRKAIVRGLFQWATWQGIVKADPSTVLTFTARPSKQRVRGGNWLTEEQARLLLAGCDQIQDENRARRDRIILMFGLLCGLRNFEIAQMRWEHLSPDLTSFRMVGKGSKMATVGIPPQLRRELEEWRKVSPAEGAALLPTARGMGRAERFDFIWDKPLGEHGVYSIVVKAGRRIGKKIATHDLRRTFCGILEDQGMPVQDISRVMRHENIGITSTYLERRPERNVEITANFTIGE